MGTYCSYCNDGPYKDKLIEPKSEDTIGGFVDGYWFCGQCHQLGMKSDADDEEHRKEKLVEAAESKGAVRTYTPEEN